MLMKFSNFALTFKITCEKKRNLVYMNTHVYSNLTIQQSTKEECYSTAG